MEIRVLDALCQCGDDVPCRGERLLRLLQVPLLLVGSPKCSLDLPEQGQVLLQDRSTPGFLQDLDRLLCSTKCGQCLALAFPEPGNDAFCRLSCSLRSHLKQLLILAQREFGLLAHDCISCSAASASRISPRAAYASTWTERYSVIQKAEPSSRTASSPISA